MENLFSSILLSNTLLLVESINDETIDKGINLIQQLGASSIDILSIHLFSISLLILFLFKLIIWYYARKHKLGVHGIENKKFRKLIFSETIGSCGLELAIAFIISFLIVIIGGIPHTQYLICLFLIPVISFLAAIFIDSKFLVPILGFEKLDLSDIPLAIDDGKKKTKKGNKAKDSKSESDKSTESGETIMSKEGLLLDEVADAENFNEIVLNFINGMKAETIKQGKQIDDIASSLNLLKESEMVNKKIELKRLIYDCLNKGFATPEENDKITLFYHSYTTLGGNGEVKDLYNNHYIKLPVHDDRRQLDSQQNDVIDRRGYYSSNTRKYSYGEFDTHNRA